MTNITGNTTNTEEKEIDILAEQFYNTISNKERDDMNKLPAIIPLCFLTVDILNLQRNADHKFNFDPKKYRMIEVFWDKDLKRFSIEDGGHRYRSYMNYCKQNNIQDPKLPCYVDFNITSREEACLYLVNQNDNVKKFDNPKRIESLYKQKNSFICKIVDIFKDNNIDISFNSYGRNAAGRPCFKYWGFYTRFNIPNSTDTMNTLSGNFNEEAPLDYTKKMIALLKETDNICNDKMIGSKIWRQFYILYTKGYFNTDKYNILKSLLSTKVLSQDIYEELDLMVKSYQIQRKIDNGCSEDRIGKAIEIYIDEAIKNKQKIAKVNKIK